MNCPYNKKTINNKIKQLHIMQNIFLKPLSEIPLSTQINRHTNEGWNRKDYIGSYAPGMIYLNEKLKIKFHLPTAKEEEEYKLLKEKKEQEEQIKLENKYSHISTPLLDLHNSKRWGRALELLKNDFSNIVESTEESYNHFLDSLPPIEFSVNGFIAGEPYMHYTNGECVFLCFKKIQDKFYAQYGTINEFRKNKLFKNV